MAIVESPAVQRTILAIAALVTSLAALAEVPLHAVDLRDVLTGYTFTSWSRKDGLSGPVWAMAQDADGYLWLGNDEGLVRFDGVRFRRWDTLGGAALPEVTVRALLSSGDRSLWVGFGASGGIARVQDKDVQYADMASGTPMGAVTAFAEDRQHTIWAATTSGLLRFRDGSWQRLGAAQGLPDIGVTGLYASKSGSLWVGTSAGLYWRPDAAVDRFQQAEYSGESIRAFALTEDPLGGMWASDPLVGFRPVLGETVPRGTQSGRGFRLLGDRSGNLWVGTIGQGLWRIRDAHTDRAPQPLERATVLSGLSSDAVRSLFEDRDGNIWAGTTEGVDRLVPHRITPWSGLGLVDTIDAAPDGTVSAGTEDEVIRFSRVGGEWAPEPLRVTLRGTRSLRVDSKGVTWVSTGDDLFRVDGQHATRVPLPQGIRPSGIEAIAEDRRAGIWVVIGDGMILRDEGNGLSLFKRVEPLSAATVTAALSDHAGRLWLLLSDTRVGLLNERGEYQTFGTENGLTAVTHYALHESPDGAIWIAGADGVNRFDNGRFSLAGRGNGIPTGALTITDDGQNNLWLATSVGLIRMPIAEYDLAAKNPGYEMHLRIFDTFDGLAGYPVLLGDSHPTRANDGTLWFVTSRGLSIADPQVLSIARAAPRVVLDDVLVNDRPVSQPALPAGSTKVQFDYTTPDLTYPFKTRFRYRLDGFDTDWIDAGSRREALYANLPPRDYTFRVAMRSGDGPWTEVERPWSFSIAPRFYQVWWFYALCAIAAAGIVTAAWRLRLRALRRQFSLVLGERVRLSRELHDTLLQSLVGVALEFDAVSKSLEASPATARERVIKIREHVEEYIREARRSIWSLRSQALETGDLLEALRESAERATADHGVDFRFNVSGPPRRPPSSVEHQLLRIGQEAVLNAVRHSSARHITMDVGFTDDNITLRVSDDGRGFDPGKTAEGTTDHYGLTTMNERAQQCGGHVTIDSQPGRGTIVEAIVPSDARTLEVASA